MDQSQKHLESIVLILLGGKKSVLCVNVPLESHLKGNISLIRKSVIDIFNN